MRELRDRIAREGRNLGRGILKVDSFINHQVDASLMMSVGRELGRRFAHAGANKVLTAEISGIAPALTTALALNVPVVYARKTKPVTMPENAYCEEAPSHTKGHFVKLLVSPEVLRPSDRVLIIDDFLAHGHATKGLCNIVKQAGATVGGIGIVIEKGFQNGGKILREGGYKVESLAIIDNMNDNLIHFK